MIPLFPHIFEISHQYSGILLDAYGVFWGGNDIGMLKGCLETTQKLIASGKKIGILSNSTQLAAKEVDKFAKKGLIKDQHYHFLITSGDLAKSIFTQEKLPFATPHKKYWLFGGAHPKFSSHEPLFEGSAYSLTTALEEADFIYISIPHIDGEDQIDAMYFKVAIEALLPFNKPMVCANPDKFAHEENPPRLVVRQGSIAAIYEELGGSVFYIGKPTPLAFAEAMHHFKQFNITHPQEVLMIGDTPETDIRGARSFSMPSALVIKTGIMADRISQKGFNEIIQGLTSQDLPTYLLEQLADHGI